MKQTALRYGFYGTLLMLVLSAIHFFILMKRLSYDQLEIAGYLTMLLSMVFVFFGIRYYRDEKNNGLLSFGQGLKLGVLIVLMPAILFGLFDVFYSEVLNPHWVDDCYDAMKRSMSASEFAARKKEFDSQLELFSNPLFQFLIMFATVFVIGFIVTIISALALRRKSNSSSNRQ